MNVKTFRKYMALPALQSLKRKFWTPEVTFGGSEDLVTRVVFKTRMGSQMTTITLIKVENYNPITPGAYYSIEIDGVLSARNTRHLQPTEQLPMADRLSLLAEIID